MKIEIRKGTIEIHLVKNKERESELIEKFESMKLEYIDGCTPKEYVPSEHSVDFPYYFCIDDDGDLYIRDGRFMEFSEDDI